MCRRQIQWWQSRTVSAALVAGWTLSTGEGSTASAGPFSQWSLCYCPTSGPEKLWCPVIWMTPLQSQCCPWWWVGGEQGVSPEVHNHLQSFKRVVKTAPDSQLLNLLSVSRLVTVLDEADQCGVICKLQELDRGVFRCAVIDVSRRTAVGRGHIPEELQYVAGWSAVLCWLHHPRRQTARGPVRVQWRTSDKTKPDFQIISWPQTLEPQVCSHFCFFGGIGDDGGAFKAWGNFAQFQWSVEDLCEDGGQLVSTGFQTGWCHTVWAWCLPSFVLFEDLMHIIFSYPQCRCGGEGGCWRCELCFSNLQ